MLPSDDFLFFSSGILPEHVNVRAQARLYVSEYSLRLASIIASIRQRDSQSLRDRVTCRQSHNLLGLSLAFPSGEASGLYLLTL